jgi:predicted flap endonuclease-1-like 5' DNA nuclease
MGEAASPLASSYGGIVAIGNLKGGVGKRTIAVGLAGAMAHAGKSVVDGDPQATSQRWLLRRPVRVARRGRGAGPVAPSGAWPGVRGRVLDRRLRAGHGPGVAAGMARDRDAGRRRAPALVAAALRGLSGGGGRARKSLHRGRSTRQSLRIDGGLAQGDQGMRYRIEHIEGIGAAFGAKLRAEGIGSTAALLEAAADPAGRRKLAEAKGINAGRVLAWANMADLMRINGVGKQFAELLEAAGVDTVKELKLRRPDNLAARMAEVNAEKKLTRAVPTESMVGGWIDEAKAMAPILTY